MVWLENRMTDLGLRVEDVARELGVSESAVKNWRFSQRTFAPEIWRNGIDF